MLFEWLEFDVCDFGFICLFCFIFEIVFFILYGFELIGEGVVLLDVYVEFVRLFDEGVVEFFDLVCVKLNIFGNIWMLK